jgi:hypothetical protein
MKKATLDILDADLSGNFARYRSFSIVDRERFYKREFLYDPTRWTDLYALISRYSLTWQEFRFGEVVANNDIDVRIPSQNPGLYIFYVRPNDLLYRFPQFALYVGISNVSGSKRPLRERLKDYLNLPTIKKRLNVHQMLQLYYDHVWVAFSLLSIPSTEMSKLEEYVHDYLGPPFGKSGYSIEVKKSIKAWDL